MKKSLLSLFLFSSLLSAVEIDQNSLKVDLSLLINNSDLNLKIKESYNGTGLFSSNKFNIAFDYLRISKDHSDFVNDSSNMYSVPIYYSGHVTNNLINSFGISFNNIDNSDFWTIGLNLGFEYNIPNPYIKSSISANIDYSPEVLCFKDSEKLINFSSTLNFEVIKDSADIIVSYRNINLSTNYIHNINYNESFYAGIKFIF
jgi:hypothetical protein